MITEDYVSYEIAKLLKEKGFDCSSYNHYRLDNGELCRFNTNCSTNIEPNNYITAPTLQMAMKWLREVHKIHISIEMGFDVDNNQYYFFVPSVCRFSDKSGEYENPFGEKEFNTCEEACESAIKYCLQNLI